jgi:asparagine synthase (glutamine-hydrolysing)
MLRILEHRGPDDAGTFASPEASLGARRLAIIDVAGGHQPALSEDGRVAVVLNGEIYNYRELRGLLDRRGHEFRSASDTEVLPHLYEDFGVAMTALLRGMFAIAIWDQQRRRLVLARDRAGEKPLYYAETPRGLVFASELKAVLMHPSVERDLDPAALALYLQLQYVPGPETILSSVRKLPPGHVAVAEDGHFSVERYWDVVPSEPSQFKSRSGAASELRALLEGAVRSQVHADRPVGALLSGGIDSAGIASLMALVGEEPPHTFTVGFEDEALDERRAARLVADAIGSRHTELIVGPPSFEELERLVWHIDEPVADQAALPTYLISQVASEHVTVVLTGEGSDELFGGYPRYRWFRLAEQLSILPADLRASLRTVARPLIGERHANLLLLGQDALDRHTAWTGVFRPDEVGGVLRPDVYEDATVRAANRFRDLLDGWSDRTPLEQAMYLDLKTWLVDDILTKADRMSMAWSIEARAPYLDHRIVEFATSLPPSARLHGLRTKPLLRKALASIVPPQTLSRRKRPFAVPLARWLSADLVNHVTELLRSSDARSREFLRPAAIERALADESREAARRVWALAILELWLRQVMEPARSSAAVRS